MSPVHASRWDLAFGVTAQQLELALQAYPAVRAVVVVSPSYHGVCADLAAIVRCVHQHDAVLIVDEAHGPHLGCHPDLPPSAIAAGADIVIQSTHKVLGAMTQASMLHVQGARVDRDRLRQALQLTQSTSPNYLLLASLDAARHQIATAGQALLGHTLAIAHTVRTQLQALTSLTVLTPEHLQATEFRLDPTRLVVDVSALGITGFTADEFLHEQQRVTAELPTLRQLAFILSLGNQTADGDRLVQALRALIDYAKRVTADAPPRIARPCPLAAALQSAPDDAKRCLFCPDSHRPHPSCRRAPGGGYTVSVPARYSPLAARGNDYPSGDRSTPPNSPCWRHHHRQPRRDLANPPRHPEFRLTCQAGICPPKSAVDPAPMGISKTFRSSSRDRIPRCLRWPFLSSGKLHPLQGRSR